MKPDRGDIVVNGVSAVFHPAKARVFIGVCPQFSAIDTQLSVYHHLVVYAKLKGLRKDEVQRDVETLMRVTKLDQYRDMAASKLSGGNQRKLMLAIALLGKFLMDLNF
jgi:ATP-binding cassette, subfamily A (ABC1), member 3